MTMTYQTLVGVPGGDVEIIGTGIRAYTILGLYELGDSAEDIADAYALPLAAVYEALAYGASHPDEMEAIRQADAAAEQRMLRHLSPELRQQAEQAKQNNERLRQESIHQAGKARRGTALS